MAFSSFRNAIGTETAKSITVSTAWRTLAPLSRSYRATKIKRIWQMRSASAAETENQLVGRKLWALRRISTDKR